MNNIIYLENTHFSAGTVYNEETLIMGGIGGIFNEMDLKESTGAEKHLKFRGKFQEADAVNKNKRLYPQSVLEDNVKKLEKCMNEGGLIGELDHPCLVDNDFEVLTPNGWKHFNEIRQGDSVFSRNDDGEMIPSKVHAVIDAPYDGKAFEVKGNAINCTFTAPHKFLMCGRQDYNKSTKNVYATIEEIFENRTKYSHMNIPKTATWTGIDKKYFTIPGVIRQRIAGCGEDLHIDTNKFVLFMGLYLSEGHISNQKNSNRIVISQKTEIGKKLIREFLSNFHEEIIWKEFSEGFHTSDARLYDYLIPLGNKYQKFVPQEIKELSSEYLEKLILAFAVGDGRIITSKDKGKSFRNHKGNLNDLKVDTGKYSRFSFFSVSKKLIQDLHECVVKIGMAGSFSVVEPKLDYMYAGRIIKAANKKPLYNLEILRSKSIHLDPRFLNINEKHHTGKIYCLTTEHGNFYMKYKGKSFWTGNCDSIVHFKDASHKITKLWWEGKTLMGEGVILNTPCGKILRSLISDGVRIGISSRGVGSGSVNENGILVIGESYKLITFDTVSDPSTYSAFQKKVSNGKNESTKNFENSFVKNETSSIDNVNKDILLACLGSVIKQQANQVKRGLK